MNKEKTKKCKHQWGFLEKWTEIPSGKRYLRFYCVKCLKRKVIEDFDIIK